MMKDSSMLALVLFFCGVAFIGLMVESLLWYWSSLIEAWIIIIYWIKKTKKSSTVEDK